MLIVLIHFSGLSPPPPPPLGKAINQQQPSTLVKTPQDPLKPFTLPQSPESTQPPCQLRIFALLLLARLLEVLMLSVNHTSGTTGEGMLNDLLKGKNKAPPSQSTKSSSDGKSRKVNWTTATSYMLGKRSCNLIPVPVRIVPLSQFWPHPFPPSPHFLPVTPPSFLPDPYQTFSSNSRVLRWPIGPSLCCEMSFAESPKRKISGVPFTAATAGQQQPCHPSKTFIRLLAS